MSAYETVVNSLYEVKDWGREEALREILQWLEDNFYDHEDCNPFVFNKTRILMENFRNNKILKISESRLRRIIQESIKKILNII